MRRAAVTEEQKGKLQEYLAKLKSDEVFALSEMIRIKNKQGQEIPFTCWGTQKKFLKHRARVNDIIKIRQQGFSVLSLALRVMQSRLAYFYPEMRNRQATIYCKSNDDTPVMFNHVRFMDQKLDKAFAGDKQHDAAKVIHYSDTGWLIRVMAAGKTEGAAEAKGRQSTEYYPHITECGYIKDLYPLQNGILGSMPDGGEMIMESTSSGPRGFFSQHFIGVMQNGKEIEQNVWAWEDRRAFFFGFLEHPEYVLPVVDGFDAQDDEEERLLKLGAEPGRVLWRRRKIADYGRQPAGMISPEVQFKRDYPVTIQDAFEEAGGAFFEQKTMVILREVAKLKYEEPAEVGLFHAESGETKWSEPAAHNRFRIWVPPAKGWKNRYAMFLDCGQGQANSDYDAAYVGDLVTRQVVAGFWGLLGPELSTENAIKLGAYYGNATIGWDATGIGSENRPHFLQANYPNLWARREAVKGVFDPNRFGLVWGKSNRAIAVSLVRKWTKDQEWIVPPDSPFWGEQQYFNYKDAEAIKPEAATGFHDDHVMSLAGLFYISQFVGSPVQEVRAGPYQDAGKLDIKRHLRKLREEDSFRNKMVETYGK